MNLWSDKNSTNITYYPAPDKKSDAAVIIFPGGADLGRAEHEGKGYAEFFQSIGVDSFVVDYRVFPDRFPLPLLDARRAVRYVRYHAKEYGINPERIAAMGSSAGGHLTALLSTYKDGIDGEGVDEIDSESFLPNAQILCYPVIRCPESGVAHVGSYENLLGDKIVDAAAFDPALLADETTPQAFIWHTAEDNTVNPIISYDYAAALRRHGVPVEMHIFPCGGHGLGLAQSIPHTAQWSGLLKNRLIDMGWLK